MSMLALALLRPSVVNVDRSMFITSHFTLRYDFLPAASRPRQPKKE
jgi:hypothetical protein